MDVEELLYEVDRTAWEDIDGPEWYRPTEVPTAFRQVISVTDESSLWDAYNAMLFAVGNNHCGTYYPAVLFALPFIVELASDPPRPIVQECCLEIIIDLASFEPDTENPDFKQRMDLAVKQGLGRITPLTDRSAHLIAETYDDL